MPGLEDAIELYNPSADPAPVGNWFLSDDFNSPRKYRLPADTVIPGGDYLVISESQFNANPADPNSFALGAEGDEVYLFSGDELGNLTCYYHGFTFGPAEANVSFGRHVLSTGEEHFVAQTARTLGAANAGPWIGPVVISEVMYHPPDYPDQSDNQEDEFIELQVGGINPCAVESALREGADVIYFPTYGEKNHIAIWGAGKPPTAFPLPAPTYSGLSPLDETGKLRDESEAILRLIAGHDAVMATGHISPVESLALIKSAVNFGVRRMLVTHVSESVTTMSLEQQKEAVQLGALIEHCFFAVTDSSPGSVSLDWICEQIRAMGVENIILTFPISDRCPTALLWKVSVFI